jgi:hypothetical protein
VRRDWQAWLAALKVGCDPPLVAAALGRAHTVSGRLAEGLTLMSQVVSWNEDSQWAGVGTSLSTSTLVADILGRLRNGAADFRTAENCQVLGVQQVAGAVEGTLNAPRFCCSASKSSNTLAVRGRLPVCVVGTRLVLRFMWLRSPPTVSAWTCHLGGQDHAHHVGFLAGRQVSSKRRHLRCAERFVALGGASGHKTVICVVRQRPSAPTWI